MYAGRDNKLCECLKSRHLVAEQVGGLAVAWELLQELGLLRRHGGSPNTKSSAGHGGEKSKCGTWTQTWKS